MSEELELETIPNLKLENENVCDKNEDYQKLVCNSLKLNFSLNTVWFDDLTTGQKKLHFRLLYSVHQ